jgi:separase
VNYIIGGAGYVIANLWDVTDKDIDKLSIHCMQKLFTVSHDPTATANGIIDGNAPHVPSMSPAEALTVSRDVCKLKNAVGSAPVVYGLPPLLH